MLYYPKAFDLTPEQAIEVTLLNELYRRIIWTLPFSSFIKNDNSLFKPFQKQSELLRKKFKTSTSLKDEKVNKFRIKVLKHNLEKISDNLYEEMFSQNMATAEKASLYKERIGFKTEFYEIRETTNLENKELVIRYYLKKQSAAVQKAKKSRGKGILEAKKNKIIKYLADHPDANNTKVAKVLGVNRKTVRKYR